jgi:6-phospho-3-hexuloisomerase
MQPFSDLMEAVLGELGQALGGVADSDLADLRQAILKADRVFVSGKGRSGLQIRGFAMRLMHMGLRVHVVDDVTTPSVHEGDLLIIGSGSGRTPSLVGHATKAKSHGAQVALITIAEQSAIGDQADFVVRIAASTPKLDEVGQAASILPMGSLFEQALGILLDILIVQLMEAVGTNSDEMFTRHANLE